MTKLDSALYIVGGGGEDCGNKVSFSSHVTSIPPSWFITAGSVPGFSSVKLLFFLPYHPLWKEMHGILSRFCCPGSRICPKLSEILLGKFVFFSVYLFLHLCALLVGVHSWVAVCSFGCTVLFTVEAFVARIWTLHGPQCHCAIAQPLWVLFVCCSAFSSSLAVWDAPDSCFTALTLIQAMATCPRNPSPFTESECRGQDLSMRHCTLLNATSP